MSLDEAEKRRVGGSDVAAIVGVSPYGSAYSVWERIVNGVERGDSPALSRGRRLEPVVLDWYVEQTGFPSRPVNKAEVYDPRRQHVRASFDARVMAPRGYRVVEAKTAGADEAHRWGDEGTDAIPLEYLCQAQHYLGFGREVGVIEDDVCDVPALIAGDFRMYVVAFDAEVYGELREAVDRFWVDHVVTKRPPDVTALPNDLEALKRRFPRETSADRLDFSTLPPASQVVLEEYLHAYAEESVATDRRALWEARAKMVVGGAPGVRGLPEETGHHRLDWAAHESGKTAWKKVAEVLAREHGVSPAALKALAAKHTGEAARPFQPRPITKGRK